MGARTRTARFGRVAASLLLLGGTGVAQAQAASADVAEKPVIISIAPPSGPVEGGHTVVVTGTGFIPGDTGVLVDGVDVAADVLSTTSLAFVAPPHEVGTVSLQVWAGDYESAAHTLAYVAPPAVIESPTATPSAQDEGPQSVEPAPRRHVPGRARQADPQPSDRDPGSRVPPELARTGSANADVALLGIDAVLAGALLLVLSRRREARVRR